MTPDQIARRIKKLEQEMLKHARNLEFEDAARIRDEVQKLRKLELGLTGGLNLPFYRTSNSSVLAAYASCLAKRTKSLASCRSRRYPCPPFSARVAQR